MHYHIDCPNAPEPFCCGDREYDEALILAIEAARKFGVAYLICIDDTGLAHPEQVGQVTVERARKMGMAFQREGRTRDD